MGKDSEELLDKSFEITGLEASRVVEERGHDLGGSCQVEEGFQPGGRGKL